MQAPGTPSDGQATGEFRITVRVYFEDTDAGGVVYYANYLKFCERARTEWLRSRGIGQQHLAEREGISFVVRSASAEFLRPARLDDELDVRSAIERLGGASVIFRQRVLRAEELLFEARITVACIDGRRMRATPIPVAVRDALLQAG